MVLPSNHMPVWHVIDVRLRPIAGYACDECVSLLECVVDGVGWLDVPLATAVEGAVRSWLPRRDSGREDDRPCEVDSPWYSPLPSRELLRREEDV